jgi:hypothetical protein
MSAILSRVRGRLRLARGRCPACASESTGGCGVCLGHQGPFPVEPAQLQRWAFRFEARRRAEPQPKSQPWRSLAETMGRAA